MQDLLVREPLLPHEYGKAPRAVAAHLHLTAVSVEDAVVEVLVRIIRGLHHEQLVEADAEVPVREAPDELRVEEDLLGYGVDDHEVVAEAVHFGELKSHFSAFPAYAFSVQETTASFLMRSSKVSRFLMRISLSPSTITSAARGREL